MSSDLIRANLLEDTISWSAQQVYNLDVGSGNNNFPGGPSTVPRYLYTCLTDLCSSFGLLSSIVVSDFGLAEVPAGFSIIVQESDEQEGSTADFIPYDDSGSAYSEIDILVKNLKTSMDINLTRDVGLRIRYILDQNLRGTPNNQFCIANNKGTVLDILGDFSIAQESPKMRWIRSGPLRVEQQEHRFCISYLRLFV